jgi:hypothetical protein
MQLIIIALKLCRDKKFKENSLQINKITQRSYKILRKLIKSKNSYLKLNFKLTTKILNYLSIEL